MTTAPAKAAARKKAAAAAAERDAQDRTIDFRGQTLTLPAVLPGTLYFDLGELADDEADIGTQVRLLTSLLGEDQVRLVRRKVADDEIPLDDMAQVLSDLFEDAFSAYGMGAGEPSASPAS